MGWSQLSNGQLLQAAEDAIDVLITTDKNLKYQQNLAGRRIAILVLPTTSWPRIRQETIAIAAAIDTLSAGQYLELSFNKTRWNRVPSAHEAGGQHTAMLCSGQLG